MFLQGGRILCDMLHEDVFLIQIASFVRYEVRLFWLLKYIKRISIKA